MKKWQVTALTVGVLLLCPDAAQAQKKQSDNGAQLLEKNGCLHCHYIRGKGGLIGPPFEGIGKVRTEQDIVTTLTKKRPLPEYYPRGIVDAREFMRHVKLDKKSAQEIAKYLISTPVEEAFEVKGHGEVKSEDLPGGFKFVPQPPSDESRKGFSLYKENGCAACHVIGGMGGRRGPDLDGVGARLNRTAIENRIARGAIVMFDGKEYRPTEYIMPPAQLSPEQVNQITQFLLTLPEKKEN